MSTFRIAGIMVLALSLCYPRASRADFIFSLDASQLEVQATGGIVNQTVDLRVSHASSGLNTFSDYELRFDPASSAVVVSAGPITVSDFVFDLHSSGGSGPYNVTGVNSTDVSVSTGSQDLLARLNLEIDTAVLTSGSSALNLSLFSISRGGVFGSSIIGEASVVPASINVSAVPEPSGGVLTLALASSALFFRRKRA